MHVYSSMPTQDFIAQIRDIAIRAGARPLVIDAIDAINEAPSESEIEDREERAAEEGRADACKEWLRAKDHAIRCLDDVEMPDEAYKAVLAILEDMLP